MSGITITNDGNVTEIVAEQYVKDVRAGIEQAKDAVYKLYCGGWQALRDTDGNEYSSFRQAMLDRFGKSISQVYRLNNARKLEIDLQSASNDDDDLTIKDTHARELKKLKEQDAMLEALEHAQTQLDAEGGDDVEIRHIKAGVKLVMSKKKVNDSSHHLLRHMMTTGDISPVLAADFIEELDKLEPGQQVYLQSLIAKHGMSDSNLIPLIARDFNRKDSHNPSRVLEWLEEDGKLLSVPLSVATVQDWGKAKYESRKQRIAEAKANKDAEKRKRGEKVVEMVICTLYKGDLEKTIKAIERALGKEEFATLKALLVEAEPLPVG